MARAVENTPRSDRIADAFVDTVFGGNFLGGLSSFCAADLNGRKNIISALKGDAAVCGSFDFSVEALLFDQFLRKSGDEFQWFLRDIYQRDSAVPQFGVRDDIGDKVARKDMTAGADNNNLSQNKPPEYSGRRGISPAFQLYCPKLRIANCEIA